ncbi:MD-2-related lipid-recognition protein-like [Anastrepha obliqua]|uniref:MD-2-related lipid-recognition protein-like n=1 Tax=Anastrepha obliqua TaxID=95512 RepID=UPI00240A4C10|nr:MD-2-related lipid-recognition protein-like [Anastrepha obliqua]
MSLLQICILIGAIAFTFAEIVDFKPCGDVDACTIHETRIDPCPQASEHLACHIRRRRPATMSFDFTPNFAAETLEAGLAWQKSATQDLPLITMDKEACKYTTCPTVANQRQTYTIDVPIESKFPLNSYTIKWTLKAPTGQICCFTNDIKVVR